MVSRAASAAHEKRVVLLSRDAAAESLESSFAIALRTHLTELDLTLEVRPAPASANPFDVVGGLRNANELSDALMVAWIVRQKPRIIVYIYEPKGPRLRARAVSLSGSSLAASEELALILRSAILARREGSELEMAEVALPATILPQTPAASPLPSSAGLAKAASAPANASSTASSTPRAGSAATDGQSTEPSPESVAAHATRLRTPQPRGGIAVGYAQDRLISGGAFGGLQWRAFGQLSRTRFGFGYVVLTASHQRSELAEVAIHRHPIQTFLAQELVTGNVRLLAELTLIADPMLRRTIWADVPLEMRAPSWRWGWSVAGALRGDVRLFSGVWLSGAAGVAVTLNPFDYEQVWAEDRRTVARILPVRPVFDFGLIWATQ